jgi:uncharacterized protein
MNGLIKALLDRRCYTHPVDSVVLKETPLSWVLLAGDYAYKVRKPVTFAFVDFSTLERRRADCFEELRLNRRFAPQLYVDVVSICGSPGAPAMGGEGQPIEYAVQMRRFAPQEELTALLERGEVTADELSAFGQRLAWIHEDSPVCERSVAAIRAAVDNIHELQKARSGDDRIGPLAEWTDSEWGRVRTIAERRSVNGRVRECHGDLHAANIVRLDEELTAFDCIEFNADLRCIDVASDVAFLFMDLLARNQPPLAYAFLNAWLEANGDYEAVGLLRFFSVYRALVRAKVATFAHDETLAERYISLAVRQTLPTAPELMITCGLSGSGKTWLSDQVMTERGAIRIRSDVERKRMAGLRAAQSSRSLPGQGLYSLEFNQRVYAGLLANARSVLESGQSIIVDAAFLKRSERQAFLEMAKELRVRFDILHCLAPQETLRARLHERQHKATDASEADISVMERQLCQWEAFADAERPFVTDVHTAEEGSVRTALKL